MLSFNSPQAIVLNILLIFILAALVPTTKLYFLPVRSVFETLFNLKLYSSGMTRAMSRLFHGDLQGALFFNKLIIVVFLVMLSILIINLIKSYRYYKSTGKLYELW